MSVPDLQSSCRHHGEASTSSATDCDFSSGCWAWAAADPGYAIRPTVHPSRDGPGPPALLRSQMALLSGRYLVAVRSLSRTPDNPRQPGQNCNQSAISLQFDCNPGGRSPFPQLAARYVL